MNGNNVSKHLIDKAALIFLKHPGQAYSRADIQKMLDVSKPTACRVIQRLVDLIALEELKEGQIVFYRLSEEQVATINKSIDFVLAISDREQLALSFLLECGESSALFGSTIKDLGEKLNRAGLLTCVSADIQGKKGLTQHIREQGSGYVETLLNALETKTKIEILYKSPFSANEKTHVLYPVGLYLRDGNLYLYAYAPNHKSATSFAYSRIKNLSLIYDDHFELPADVSMAKAIQDPFGIAITNPRRAKIHIFQPQAFYEKEKDWPEDTIIQEYDDGSIDLEVTISDPYAFRTWALALGKDGYVVCPEDLAEWIHIEHIQAARLYEKSYSHE